MGVQPVERTIEGENYTFYYLRPKTSIKILAKLSKMIGPAIGAAFPKGDSIKVKDILDTDINIGNALSLLVEKIDIKDTQEIIDVLFENVFCKGRGKLSEVPVYEELFTGNLKLFFTILKNALEVQYGNFFGVNGETKKEEIQE